MEQYTFNKEQIEGIMYGYAAHVQQFDIKAITPSEWLSKNAPAQPSPAKAEQEGPWKSMEQEEPKYGMLRFVRGVILNPEPGITNGEKVHTINQFWDIANYRSYTKKWSCEDDNRKVTHWMDIPPIESDTPPVKEAAPHYKLTIEQLSTRERKFFDLLKYILLDEALALGYCGAFEEAVKEAGQPTKEGEIAFAEYLTGQYYKDSCGEWTDKKGKHAFTLDQIHDLYQQSLTNKQPG